MFCADCGEKMYNHRSRGGKENNFYPSDFFDCSTYTLSRQKRYKDCKGHFITTKNLRTLILDTIRTISTLAISNQDEFIEKVRNASQLRQAEAAKEIKRKLNKERKRITELDNIIKKLYESFATDKISEERFDSLMSEYEAEQKSLQISVDEADKLLFSFNEDTDRAEKFIALAKKYTDFSELTTMMINEFIDKIIVHAPERVDGERTQEVEIYLNFIGHFELPEPELTPEEIKRQETLRRHRIKNRERYKQLKEGTRVKGQIFEITCKCCGETFETTRSYALFCNPNCRAKYYRQEAAKERSREISCENCGETFTATRSDAKYCCDECRYEGHIKGQRIRNEARRNKEKSNNE